MRTGALLAAVLLSALTGCGAFAGHPRVEQPPVRPEDVMDFHALFEQNCQACHGAGGQNGPAMDLANPEFQALVDDNTLREIISNGLKGTQMPAWSHEAGGMLTDRQIGAIIAGMRQEWAKPNAYGGATPPPFEQPQGGDVKHGQQAYQARCASCHKGSDREQVTSPVYLSLVSDQALRSIIIAGRPDIGQPDWRHDTANGAEGQPLSGQDVTDIVAWLGSLRNPDAVSAAPNPIPPRR
jgi:cytochrome c oxidase cbb3-type subunit 3